jgi:trehalose 6-phosphate synthase
MPPWTRDDLRNWVAAQYGSEQILVLANREPFSHVRSADGVVGVTRSTSGVVTAVEPLVRTTGGVWIAHGSGSADALAIEENDGLGVPPESPAYRLRRVWLQDDELAGYYDGFANQGLWPLCHRVHVRPVFRSDDFNSYWHINGRFVDAVCEETRTETPVVLVQDYHFALAPQMIRERLPRSTIATFWHIPWPAWQSFEICPWGSHVIEGLLGSDVIGLQTPSDCRNFLDTVGRCLEAHIDREAGEVTYSGRRTRVRAYPTSIDWPDPRVSQPGSIDDCRRDVRERLAVAPDVRLGVGIARLDYTKGLEETFAAVERLLECYPEYRGAFSFVQVAEPSRTRVDVYRELALRVRAAADRVNRRFGREGYRPVVLLDAHVEPAEVYRLLRAADVCYVASLHDGMNLVAKEFAAARDDHAGALVLSQFAGAARELPEALLVNPYDIDEAAHALVRALLMPPEEQAWRIRRMRATISEDNAYKWGARILADVARVRNREGVPDQSSMRAAVTAG